VVEFGKLRRSTLNLTSAYIGTARVEHDGCSGVERCLTVFETAPPQIARLASRSAKGIGNLRRIYGAGISPASGKRQIRHVEPAPDDVSS